MFLREVSWIGFFTDVCVRDHLGNNRTVHLPGPARQDFEHNRDFSAALSLELARLRKIVVGGIERLGKIELLVSLCSAIYLPKVFRVLEVRVG
jgi:hypothetical protein